MANAWQPHAKHTAHASPSRTGLEDMHPDVLISNLPGKDPEESEVPPRLSLPVSYQHTASEHQPDASANMSLPIMMRTRPPTAGHAEEANINVFNTFGQRICEDVAGVVYRRAALLGPMCNAKTDTLQRLQRVEAGADGLELQIDMVDTRDCISGA